MAIGIAVGVGVAVHSVPSAEPGTDMIERYLLDKRHPVPGQRKGFLNEVNKVLNGLLPSVVPPLEDEDESRDEGRRPGERHVKLGSQRGEKHGSHGDVFSYFERTAKVVEYKDDLGKR